MFCLASKQPGFLGVETLANTEGYGITISYWETLEAIKNWKNNPEHRQAQINGKKLWYKNYSLKICKVEKNYFF